MKQPPGFAHLDFSDHVCRLKKVIYSLKLAPRAWFRWFISALIFFSFGPNNVDSSLFIYFHGSTHILLLLSICG